VIRHYPSPYFYPGLAEEELCLATTKINENTIMIEELYLVDGKVTFRHLYYEDGMLKYLKQNAWAKLERYKP
jgi:hypothetical protein